MTVHTSRRSIFGGAGLIAVAALTKCGSTPAYAAATDAEWDRLYRDFQATSAHAKIAMDAFNVAEERHNDRLRSIGDKPARPTPPPFDTSMSLAAIVETTNDATYKRDWADYERRLAQWEARRAALHAEVLDEAEEAWTNADSAVLAVLDRIRTYPVTTITMLSQKAEVLDSFFAGQLDARDALALVADIRRLEAEA